MKKSRYFFLFALVLLGLNSPVFALQCKDGNFGSDECWTTVQLVTSDRAIIAGTVLVYDFTTPTQAGNSADNAAFYARVATSVDQANIVAGVAQRTYSSGDRAQLLVRGQGQLKVEFIGGATAVASQDRLFLLGSSGTGQFGTTSTQVAKSSIEMASRDQAVAFALEASSTEATIDAYITIV